MSRWQVEFDQHPFQSEWRELIEESMALVIDDQTVLTSVQELARLQRVIEYLRSAIENLDVELVPKNVWDSFQPQSKACLQQIRTYKSNRNAAHLQTANQHLDNLLTYVRPYMILPTATFKVLSSSALTYKRLLEEYVNKFLEKSKVNSESINTIHVNSQQMLAQVLEAKARIDACNMELLIDTPERPSLKTRLNEIKSDIDKKNVEIDNFYAELLVDTKNADSIKTKIETANADIVENFEEIETLLSDAKNQVEALNIFHQKIFGKEDPDGTAEVGLKHELDQRISQLNTFEVQQNLKYSELYKKIESLLPGATSAGLAKAYETLRRSFSKPIKNNERLFYASICLMPLIAILTSIESYTFPLSITFVNYPNFEAILKSMFLKIPFVAPLVWLAIFASLRRSQYERLQQEYAHKEALAKSYDSYKKQLEALLATDSEPLQKELIAKAIDAISFNASSTLDGKSKDKTPLEFALDSLGTEKVKQLIDFLKGWMPNSKS